MQHHPWGMMRIRSSAIGGRLEDPGFLTGRAPKRLRSPAVELIALALAHCANLPVPVPAHGKAFSCPSSSLADPRTLAATCASACFQISKPARLLRPSLVRFLVHLLVFTYYYLLHSSSAPNYSPQVSWTTFESSLNTHHAGRPYLRSSLAPTRPRSAPPASQPPPYAQQTLILHSTTSDAPTLLINTHTSCRYPDYRTRGRSAASEPPLRSAGWSIRPIRIAQHLKSLTETRP